MHSIYIRILPCWYARLEPGFLRTEILRRFVPPQLFKLTSAPRGPMFGLSDSWHAGETGIPFDFAGAEGATAPETLRQKDRVT